tara:strand:- start:9824 stop:11527 length:1704 start_codon:yes stop_codon:yes gene_type:complete
MKIKKSALEWCRAPFDLNMQNQVKSLINKETELKDAFYKDIEFGTGGIRGIMGPGTNRINKYTLGKVAQGLSLYLKDQFRYKKIKAVIAYDSRNKSEYFAQIVANILSANSIQVFLFNSLRSTPQLSYTIRSLKANCGIVITASHNPPDYNGFKLYWKDGGQIVPPKDIELEEIINSIKYNEILFEGKKDKLTHLGKNTDAQFHKVCISLAKQKTNSKRDIKIVFTSLHGTSINSIPVILEKVGYKNISIVKEQSTPNGNFPTVLSPNPEEPEALKIAVNQAQKENAEIVIGTDPDSDRLGIAVKNEDGDFILLNGNQTMMIMSHFLLSVRKEKKLINSKDYIASTIVSSPVIKKVASYFKINCILTLTGFKWIGKEIENRKNENFIFGGEESFGYLIGNKIRDKDAITSALLACEIGSVLKCQGKTIFDFMIECYKIYGPYKERLINKIFTGKSGAEKIHKMMSNFRKNPPKTINESKLESVEDYLFSYKYCLKKNKKYKLNLPKANVLIYILKDKSKIAIRPSGTEPKIKFYISVNKKNFKYNNWKLTELELEKRIDSIVKELKL